MRTEIGNGNDLRKRPDKGYHTIIFIQVEFYSTMYLCSIVWILLLKRVKLSNRAATSINTLKEQSRMFNC